MSHRDKMNVFEHWKDGLRDGLWQAVADMQIDQKVFNDLQGVVNGLSQAGRRR